MTTVIDTAVLDVLASPKVVDAVERFVAARRRRREILVAQSDHRIHPESDPGSYPRGDLYGRDRFFAERAAREALDDLGVSVDQATDAFLREEASR